MRRLLCYAYALALFAALMSCGGGGGDGTETPKPPPPPPAGTSTWPLTAGSRWGYQVTDPLNGTFQKFVEVIGAEQVPESSATAVRMRDVEPTQEEWAWLVEAADGKVTRVREEDRRSGVVVRTTTFDPGALKAFTRAPAAGWTERVSFTEVERTPAGLPKTITKTYEWKVLAEGQSVTVPAGTFTCVQVQRQRVDTPDEPIRTYWFAPGIGKVREESRERIEELTGYDVK